MQKGQVYKIHSDLYTVRCGENFYTCRIREILKKQKQNILAGDFVEFENDVICEVLPRKSFIKRPAVANIDQILIVCAVVEPDLDYTQLDRYIALATYYNIPILLCFNKIDLNKDKNLMDEIKNIYSPLGYNIVFTSNVNKIGLDDLKMQLKGKITALCGNSGVGKSSLINSLNPNIHLKTNIVSDKTKSGTHTTRHCEIIPIDDSTNIVDTPGFSNLKFDFLLPKDLGNLFVEIKNLKNNCKYSDCLHINESGCEVIKNFSKISDSRYNSYREFLNEAFEYKELVKYNGVKTETNSKINNNKTVAKISEKKRQFSRKRQKQTLYREIEDEQE